jgi:ribosomal 50S subunit-recycling heat shock protein
MRLDRYLKVTRAIKRRSVARVFCDNGWVRVNGIIARAHRVVREEDLIEIHRSGPGGHLRLRVFHVPLKGIPGKEDFFLERDVQLDWTVLEAGEEDD